MTTKLQCKTLFDHSKITVYQFSSIYIWMAWGNLGMTGSGAICHAGSMIAPYLDPSHVPLFWFYNQDGIFQ